MLHCQETWNQDLEIRIIELASGLAFFKMFTSTAVCFNFLPMVPRALSPR
jgi:hypothetical protein